jgi:hypothetical protein
VLLVDEPSALTGLRTPRTKPLLWPALTRPPERAKGRRSRPLTERNECGGLVLPFRWSRRARWRTTAVAPSPASPSRTSREFYYTNLDQLTSIVKSEKGWKVFKEFFPRDTWFPELVSRFEVSRNVVAHMNPLTKKDITRLEDGMSEWLDQVADNQPPR